MKFYTAPNPRITKRSDANNKWGPSGDSGPQPNCDRKDAKSKLRIELGIVDAAVACTYLLLCL